MKKLLLVLLGLTVTFVGCGSLSVEEKEDLVETFLEMDYDELEEKFQDAKFTEVDAGGEMSFYVKSPAIKEKKIDLDDFEDIEGEFEQGEAFAFMEIFSVKVFTASKRTNIKDEYVLYTVTISEDSITLGIALNDEDDELLVFAMYTYEDGELVLGESFIDEDDEFDELIDDHEKKAVKFFDKVFKTLDSVIN